MTDSHERWPWVDRPRIVRCRSHDGSQSRLGFWPVGRVQPQEQRRLLLIRGEDARWQGPAPDGEWFSDSQMPKHLTLVQPSTLDLREPHATMEFVPLGSDQGLPLDELSTGQTWVRRRLGPLRGFLLRLIEGGALSDPTLFRAPGDVS